MRARKDSTIRVPRPADVAGAAADQALQAMGAQMLSRAPDGSSFSARTSASVWSLGEQITVRIEDQAPGASVVHVSSEASQLVDWGKNARNLEQFEHALNQALLVATTPAVLPSAAPVLPAPEAPRALPAPERHRVFVSYRRDDSGTIVGRICDRLARDLGADRVFKDVDSIPFGVDFVAYLDHEVEKCTVLFAVIGPGWLARGADGRRRIDDPNDFVRIEIASALRREIPVVPLLVDGGSMPAAEDLPDDLRLLARRNGIDIRHDPDFHADMTRLLSRLG